jgi:hypothetical protein
MPNERFACAQDVKKLLGLRLSAHWPEACADSSRHDNTIFVALHDSFCRLNFTNLHKDKIFLYLCKILCPLFDGL